MVNKQKVKGTQWENQFVSLVNENIKNANAKRVPASGAMGTVLGEALLTGDITIEFPSLPKKIRAEAKTGYGGAKQLTIKKEWIDKIKMEAENSFSYPLLVCKFLGSRKKDGVQYFVVLDFDTFASIINYVEELKEELDNGKF